MYISNEIFNKFIADFNVVFFFLAAKWPHLLKIDIFLYIKFHVKQYINGKFKWTWKKHINFFGFFFLQTIAFYNKKYIYCEVSSLFFFFFHLKLIQKHKSNFIGILFFCVEDIWWMNSNQTYFVLLQLNAQLEYDKMTRK